MVLKFEPLAGVFGGRFSDELSPLSEAFLENCRLNSKKCHQTFYSWNFRQQIIESLHFWHIVNKVLIFWEGHKILQNLHLTFDWH